MAVMNPCCCSLRTGTMAVAIFNICESVVFLLYHVFQALIGAGVVYAVSEAKRNSKSDEPSPNYYNRNSNNDGEDEDIGGWTTSLVSLILATILITFFMVNIVVSILLLVGAKQANVSKCWTWFVVISIFLLFYIFYKVAITTMTIVTAGLLTGLVLILLDMFFALLLILATCYQLWVVYAYVDELKSGRRSGGGTEYPGVVYSVTPKHENQPASAPHFPPMDYGSPPPPYQPTTYAPTSEQPARPRGPYNPAGVGHFVLPVLTTKQ